MTEEEMIEKAQKYRSFSYDDIGSIPDLIMSLSDALETRLHVETELTDREQQAFWRAGADYQSTRILKFIKRQIDECPDKHCLACKTVSDLRKLIHTKFGAVK